MIKEYNFFSFPAALALASGVALAPAASLADTLAGPIAAEVERIVDGDTVKVRAKIWVDQEVTVSVRLEGVDAPELFRPHCESERAKAVEARDFAAQFLAGERVILHNVHYGKYAGRVVARLENARGGDLGAALVAAGLAVDGASGAWCGETS